MLNSDINIFLVTLIYPVSNAELLFCDDPFRNYINDFNKEFEKSGSYIFCKSPNKSKVRENLLNYIKMNYNLNSYDYIYQYLDRWFLNKSVINDLNIDNITLYDLIMYYLNKLSVSMISTLDGQIIYKYWENEGDIKLLGGFAGNNKIHLFRSLNQMIPMDILVAIFSLKNFSKDSRKVLNKTFNGHVYVTDSLLEQVLKKGIAENHLHINASLTFSNIWEYLMDPNISLKNNMFKGMFKNDVDIIHTSKKIKFYWVMARYIRLYLATLCVFDKDSEYVKNIFNNNDLLHIRDLLDYKKINFIFNSVTYGNDFNFDFFEKNEKAFQVLYNFKEFKELILYDENNGYSEGLFLSKIIQFLEFYNGEESIYFKELFINYLRLKHSIFKVFVQNKRIGGLNYFKEYFKNLSNNSKKIFNHKDSNNFLREVFRVQLSIPNIRKIEFRTSFSESIKEANQYLKTFFTIYREFLHKNYCNSYIKDGQYYYEPKTVLPRISLLLHFTKEEQNFNSICSEQFGVETCLYGSLYKKYKKQLEIFKYIRNSNIHPHIDKFLVGIDVASAENTVPTWVFSAIYENARDGYNEFFAKNSYNSKKSLRFTFHAGEDFRHIFSGIRRVYEASYYLKFHAGDRIGHGIALGISVEDWCFQNPNVVLPRIEALENYIWAYDMLSRYKSNTNATDLLYIEKRIYELSKIIFDSNSSKNIEYCKHIKNKDFEITTENLIEAYHKLFKSNNFEKYENYNCKYNKCELFNEYSPSDYIVNSYHCGHYTIKMYEIIHYRICQQEISIIKTLQEIVKNYISKEGIIIEVNPNSNVVIGPIDILNIHPLYKMSKYNCNYDDLMVCVNSDNPGTFQTNVLNEIGFVYMNMLEQGIGRQACLEWIERIRQNGIKYSFIDTEINDTFFLKQLDELIESF